MSTTIQMLDSYPNGSGGTYAKNGIYTLTDDALAAWFISTGRARKTSGVSEVTGDGYAIDTAGRDMQNQRLSAPEVLGVRARSIAAINFNRTNLNNTLAAMAKCYSGTARWTLGAIGDSTTAGGAAVPIQAGGIAACVKSALLKQGFTPSGTGVYSIFSGGSTFYPGVYDTRMTYTGTWSAQSWGSSIMKSTSGTACTITYAADVAGDTVEVWYYDAGSVTFTVAVDGGSAVTVTCANTGVIKAYTVAVSNATHSIVVNSNSNVVYIAGIGLTVAASGIRTLNFAEGGSQANALYYQSAVSAMYHLVNAGAQTVLVGGGYNDMNAGGLNADAALASVLSIATYLKSNGVEPILLGVNPSSFVTAKIADYNTKLIAAAYANNFPVLDSTPLFISQSLGLSNGYYNDFVHLTNAGSGLQGRMIAQALLSI